MFYRIFTLSSILCSFSLIQAADNQLEQLKKERSQEEIQAANLQTESQKNLMLEWNQFGEEMEAVRDHQQRADKLTEQIKILEKEPVKK
jgi:hypothetical protein